MMLSALRVVLHAVRDAMPTCDAYIMRSHGGDLVTFAIGREGVFLSVARLQLALLWPGVKA
jgi:hypothetical protein